MSTNDQFTKLGTRFLRDKLGRAFIPPEPSAPRSKKPVPVTRKAQLNTIGRRAYHLAKTRGADHARAMVEGIAAQEVQP